MTAAAHEVLRAARIQAEMSYAELWLAYFALGGAATAEDIRSYLAGSTDLDLEYDMIALALNERFAELGHDHPVPYLDELP